MVARLALALVALVLAGAPGCGGGGEDPAVEAPSTETATGEAEPGPEPETQSPEAETQAQPEGPTESVPEETATTEPAGRRAYEIWLADRGFVRLAWRLGPDTDAVARAALDLLLAERVATAVPSGTGLRAVEVEGGRATVDLAGRLGSGQAERLALAQVVYTVTQFEGVRAVEVLAEGEPVPGLAGPHTRTGLEDVVAPVVVESPTGLERVSTPIVVSGTANTFEANVLVRVLGDLGQELASTFATATCGSGCRGTFRTSVDVPASVETPVTLVVGEDDPSGGEGRPPYAVEVPLLLRP